MRNLVAILDGVPVKKCAPREFAEKYKNVTRFFDHREGLGIRLIEAEKKGLEPQLILRRRDGWSVACTLDGFKETFKLYPDTWEELLIKTG